MTINITKRDQLIDAASKLAIAARLIDEAKAQARWLVNDRDAGRLILLSVEANRTAANIGDLAGKEPK